MPSKAQKLLIILTACNLASARLTLDDLKGMFQGEFDQYIPIAESDDIVKLKEVPEIIRYWGYPVESHKVVSKDGYVSTLFRIPTGKVNETDNCGIREPVIIHHGLMSASACWVMMNGDNNLPFYLADRCFDVWLTNARGTNYSQEHTTLSTEDQDFWEFSWNEIGKYDIPAVIDYILETAGTSDQRFEQVSYVGHSMGTTVFFVGMHHNPSYNAKIRKMVALSPVAHLNHTGSGPIKALMRLPEQLVKVFEAIMDVLFNGMFNAELFVKLLKKYAPQFCSFNPDLKALCHNALYAVAGYRSEKEVRLDGEMIVRSMTHALHPTSVRTVTHYAQVIRSGIFGSQTNNLRNMNPPQKPHKFLKALGLGSLADALFVAVHEGDPVAAPGAQKGQHHHEGHHSGRSKRSLFHIAKMMPHIISKLNKTNNTGPKQFEPVQVEPYWLNRTTCDLMAMYGLQDNMVVPEDALRTAEELGTPADRKKIMAIENCAHLDFAIGTLTKTNIYEPLGAYLLEGKPTWEVKVEVESQLEPENMDGTLEVSESELDQ